MAPAKKRANKKTTRAAPRRDAGRPRGAPVEAEILRHTVAELAEHGVEGFSIERVAKAAELNKTSVYRRFGSRDALVAAALDRVRQDLELTLVDTGALESDLQALVANLCDAMEATAGRALVQAAFAPSAGPHIAALAKRRLEEGVEGPAAALVGRAVARGQWRADADPTVVFSMVVGALLHRVYLEGSSADEVWRDQVVDLVLAAVRPRD